MRTKTDLHIPGTKVRMGDQARDTITGFEGLVTTHSRHITGCDTVWLTGLAKDGDKGTPTQSSCDVLALELVEENPRCIESMPKDVPAAG